MEYIEGIQILINKRNALDVEVWTKKYISHSNKINFVDEETVNTNKDLLIINPSISVTPNFLISLENGLYHNKNIGTVSPFSCFELKKMNENCYNKYAKNNLKQFEKALEACIQNEFVDVEFNFFDCILIKNEVLSQCGIPDYEIINSKEKTKKWFETVEKFGWWNKTSIKAMFDGMATNAEIDDLKNRFDFYWNDILNNCWENVEVFYNLNLLNGRKTILHYVLADFREGSRNNIGGTQFHVKDLVEAQKYEYNVFVLARDDTYLRLVEYVDENEVEFAFYIGEEKSAVTFFSESQSKINRKILKSFGISLVHVHHTLGMSLDIFNDCKECNIPVLFTVHDFYYICPVLKISNLNNILCDVNSCKKDSLNCLMSRKNIVRGNYYLEKWHNEHRRALDICSQIIFPSDYAKIKFLSVYPEIENKSVIIEHGIKPSNSRVNVEKKKKSKFRVAFIGGISEEKGGPLIYEIITKEKKEVEWYIMGGIGYLPLYHLEQTNLKKTGWYKRDEIYKLLVENKIDIVCILSTIPETFCYTLSETIEVGIPVIATNVGALGKRVEIFKCGWLINRDGNVDDFFKIIDEINNNPILYDEKRHNISEIKKISIDDMVKKLDCIYQNVFIKEKKIITYSLYNIVKYKQSDFLKEQKEKYLVERAEFLRLKEYEQELSDFKKSLIIKVAIKLRAIRMPLKLKIILKKIVIKIYHK